MIDKEENLEVPDDFQKTEIVENSIAEILPSEEIEKVEHQIPDSSQKSSSNIEKKIPPLIPPKPEKLKVKKSDPACSKSEVTNPKVMIYKEDELESMYECAKRHWIRFGYNPEYFDLECFAVEIDNHSGILKLEDSWDCILNKIIQERRNLINRKNKCKYSYNTPSNETIALEIRTYNKKRGTEYISNVKNFKTDNFIEPKESLINQKECEIANNDDWSDADDDWYDQLEE